MIYFILCSLQEFLILQYEENEDYFLGCFPGFLGFPEILCFIVLNTANLLFLQLILTLPLILIRRKKWIHFPLLLMKSHLFQTGCVHLQFPRSLSLPRLLDISSNMEWKGREHVPWFCC